MGIHRPRRLAVIASPSSARWHGWTISSRLPYGRRGRGGISIDIANSFILRHCTGLPKPPTPNNVAADRKKGHVSGGGLIKKVNADYPAAARQAHIQGTVVLCATISKKGVVQNVRPLFGPEELIPAAVEAAKQWRYEPYRVKKQPVEVDSEIRMDFTLPR